jgi:uncharacterized repeat protein (TIGR01451 family)
MTASRPDAEPSLRWLRIVAIAVGAAILSSCRPLTMPDVLATTAAAAVFDAPPDSAAPATDGSSKGVIPAAHAAPCPPLPRGCRRCGVRPGAEPCGTPACAPPACLPTAPPPVVRPCLVCDGGDAAPAARPVGPAGLANLAAGDTVARFRAADDGPCADAVHLATSNCACVYAPRFASVREVVRPLEEAAPDGPRGLAIDTHAGERTTLDPVRAKSQLVALVSARRAEPGFAIDDRLGPLAVDRADVPHEDQGREHPAANISEEQPELARRRVQPLVKVGFDVPIAWTCLQAANVLSADRTAQVVAVDRGTATLRFEEPGRAELTLCKRAGTDTARPGEELDFTIFMLNSGDRPLADIVLADALPARLELVPGSAVSSLPADVSVTTGDDGAAVVTWKFRETLAAGASGFVRFRALVR